MSKDSMDSNDSSTSEPAASSVCHVCRGLGDLSNPRGFAEKLTAAEQRYWPPFYADCEYIYIYVHHSNVVVLRASAEAGCDGCTVLYNSLKTGRHGDIDLDTTAASYPPVRGPKQPESVANTDELMDDDNQAATKFADIIRQDRAFDGMRLEHYVNGRVVLSFPCDHESGPRACSTDRSRLTVRALTTPPLIGYSVFFINSPYDPLDPETQHRPCRDLLSDPHIGLINRWIDTCRTGHSSCNKGGYKQPLPSRVLELSEPGNDESVCRVRLVETHGKMQEAYACLSYCWGDTGDHNPKGKTTILNYSKRLQAITLSSLPKTIIDTIHLCFKLGFRFLWVDRLCIIQDNEEDWENEASRMCDIYSRSALTISVPLCTESSQSFLKRRLNPYRLDEKNRLVEIDYIDESLKKKALLCLTSGYLSRNRASWFLETSWRDFPALVQHQGNRWIRRGWTFQEWMLSPRVLHIDTMTLWDCFDGYANELNRRYTGKPHLLRDPEQFGEGISWAFIVKEFVARDITYEKDRLPALAGLAARYSQITGNRYLAGLWFEEMPRSLLWRKLYGDEPEMPDDDETVDSERAVPSWSWASIDIRVHYDTELLRRAKLADSFIPEASVYRCSDHTNSVSAREETWIDIEGYISVVTDQDMPGHFWGASKSRLKGGNDWWDSIPDRVLSYPREDIAQSRIHLLVLGSSSLHGREYGRSSDFGSSIFGSSDGSSDGGSSDGGSSDDRRSYDRSSHGGDANRDEVNINHADIDGTRSGESCSTESRSEEYELEDTGRIYGALVLTRCGLIDDRQCFRRLGVAYLHWIERLKIHDGPSWELQDVRLI
ncbi:hypothetical protein KVR01_003847 [Diaporthe batatas]|uniref:uncharacterized protein n=1 Tax=Diaporthe batatas TaxID=748121 RepID=UPI001D038BE1|nr:uncharacterized protein KVR01_003847 [Diaporthe batatas]KAG8168158.1 hypothetical protein KVR01_003847 [Diaporthe batatas]